MKKRGIPEEGVSRRSFLKGAFAAGTAGLLGATAYGTLRSLISPPFKPVGDVTDSFVYIMPERAELPIWYEDLIGEEALVDHFDPGMGAGVSWKRVVDEEGSLVFPGFPALLLRMEEETLTFPEEYPRDDFVVDGIYAVFNCCTHACCPPGWQLIPREKYTVDPGFETVYCQCHFSQYDPRKIEKYTHPPPPEASGAEYIGISKIPGLGPADRGMPLIKVGLEGRKLVGQAADVEWYRYLAWRNVNVPEE
jgi:Rieske Fe-S protein